MTFGLRMRAPSPRLRGRVGVSESASPDLRRVPALAALQRDTIQDTLICRLWKWPLPAKRRDGSCEHRLATRRPCPVGKLNLNGSLLALRFAIVRPRTAARGAEARVASPVPNERPAFRRARRCCTAGGRGSGAARRRRACAGAAARRHGVPDPRGQRAARPIGSQVLFARWMGSFEFGIYVYVWTWVLLLGRRSISGSAPRRSASSRNIATAACSTLLRGFVSGSRWLAVARRDRASRRCGAGFVRLLAPWLDDYTVIPLYLACITLPAYALANVAGRHLAQLRLGRPRP